MDTSAARRRIGLCAASSRWTASAAIRHARRSDRAFPSRSRAFLDHGRRSRFPRRYACRSRAISPVARTCHQRGGMARAGRSAVCASGHTRGVPQTRRRRSGRYHRLLLRDGRNGFACAAFGSRQPASGALLPQTHIAILPTSRIVAAHEDAFALIRAERGELPRAVNLVSGPSRTAISNRPSCLARMGRIACM